MEDIKIALTSDHMTSSLHHPPIEFLYTGFRILPNTSEDEPKIPYCAREHVSLEPSVVEEQLKISS